MKIQYSFTSEVWQYQGAGGWYFISLPIKLSKEIRACNKSEEAGWGRLTTTARIGDSEWKTAIWFDTKHNTYLLPLKAEIRKKEKLVVGKIAKTIIFI
ncbi:MAG: DUF1905 domain-containing protein [Flavobacteriales bacterium]